MAENPEVAATIPTAKIGAFKQRMNRANNIDDIPLNKRTASDKAVKKRGPIYKHQNVTQAALQTARDICRGSPCECRSTEHPNQSQPKIEQLHVPEKASPALRS
jgi:hypothetical protein